MDIITFRYKSTNYYILDGGAGLLAFDAGWPNTFREYRDCLREQGRQVTDIRWVIVSHFHIDHAGLCGVFVDRGVEVVVFENQLSAILEMESLIARKKMTYTAIDHSRLAIQRLEASRALLKRANIDGEVIQTDGHGDQSVSLLLDGGTALVGDLAPEEMVGDYDEKTRKNWEMIRGKGMKFIKPAHAQEYSL
jgi:endoribonuclease LACTB2